MKESNSLSVSQMSFLTNNLGVDDSSASTIWIHIGGSLDKEYYYLRERMELDEVLEGSVPAFSLSDVIKLLGAVQINTITGGYSITVKPKIWDHALPYPCTTDESLIGAAYKMLCKLNRKK